MVTIHKAVLDFSESAILSIQMPWGSDILKLGVQYNVPTIWYACDTGEVLESRLFQLVCTGQKITNEIDGDYLGTVLLDNDNFVGHIFEIYQ